MKKFKLPILNDNGDKSYIDCEIDVTLKSQLKWEAEFAKQAESEDIFSYTERIGNIQNLSAAKIIAALKAVYCFIEIDGINTFNDFLSLFVLTNSDYLKELILSLSSGVELIVNSPSTKNLQSRESNS